MNQQHNAVEAGDAVEACDAVEAGATPALFGFGGGRAGHDMFLFRDRLVPRLEANYHISGLVVFSNEEVVAQLAAPRNLEVVDARVQESSSLAGFLSGPRGRFLGRVVPERDFVHSLSKGGGVFSCAQLTNR